MRYILILVLIVMVVAPLKAQEEFAPIGAEWYFDKVEDWNPPDEGYVKMVSLRDTNIKDLPSKLIHKMYYTSTGDSIDWGYEYLHQSGDTIFYLVDNVFKVLYNFSVEKGDTMNFYSEEYNPCSDEKSGSVAIDSSFTQTINGTELKGLLCSPTDYSAWQYYRIVEKIGSYSGFYPQYMNTCGIMDDLPTIGGLRCYSDNELGLYKTGTKACDTLIRLTTGVTDKEELAIPLQLYPSVTKQHIVVKAADNFKEAEPYQIINQAGAIVRNGKITESNSRIDISDLDAGVYYFVLDKMYDKPQSFIKQ